ncbi:3-dehydroquinate synthase family protein [Engelhardtia mirabilis]|uniref:3-dehydroquinate synthase n=1 Tax=Engelhardtia mirabilis TaxID=2528011 RepID=A0A518BF82_9BACT|nr:3-dehydroquinate synthase [Planctomycetes bacterium Pla133]QDU99970.1 3-dehydroquinate synthase [Planctomycetes bacterium Pla86]
MSTLGSGSTPISPTHRAALGFTVQVPREDSYSVLLEAGLVHRTGSELARRCDARRHVVLTDERVADLHLEALLAGYRRAGLSEPDLLTVTPGEGSKTIAVFGDLLERLARMGFDRRGLLVCFGGGVISDLGGFVASAYMRGVRYANVPTTLIGQLDASVGGKVAVDSPQAKNLYGAFHHPVAVLIDPRLLATLGPRDFRSGIAEAIKVAVIASPQLFARLQAGADRLRAGDVDELAAVVHEAARLKMELIARDPYEADLRRPLNFGHTLGHPLETDRAYVGVRHGEAVAVGMAVATQLARSRGTIDEDDASAILDLLAVYGLDDPVGPVDGPGAVARLAEIRMIRGGALNFVLPRRIGDVEIVADLDEAELLAAFERRAAEIVQPAVEARA